MIFKGDFGKMKNELNEALNLFEKEKGIKKEYILEALETALVHAYKKNYKEYKENVEIRIDSKTGDIKVISKRIVVENIGDLAESNEILIGEAREIKKDAQVGDYVDVEILPKDFGRIAAQTAKQIILQKIREAEKEQILKEFDIREGDIIGGEIDRIEKVEFRPREGMKKPADAKPRYNVYVNIGKAEAVVPSRGQTPGEVYMHGKRMMFYVTDINNAPKGPSVQLSRTQPELVVKLFEREVPEIKEGTVEIKSVSREAGVRSKIAVATNDANVEPVGACVGNRGMRVNAVVSELSGEKVDIVKYSTVPEEFIAAAIAPASVSRVIISDEAVLADKKEALVIVDDNQLSLAIGKEGLNAKLAAKLTGWKIDIKSTAQYLNEAAAMEDVITVTEEGEEE